MAIKKSEQIQISKSKVRIFYFILLLVPVLLLGLLESGLHIVNYGGNLDLFIPIHNGYGDYLQCNPEVGRRYFFTQQTVPTPSHDLILQEKPENGFRIFVLGGSTAAGFPYGGNLMFSRILHFQLMELLPNRHIEMMNVAMSAINSYTLVDYIDEILAQKPDLILIYAGHNEYYGALGCASMESIGKNPGWIRRLMTLRKFKTYLFLRDIHVTLRKLLARSAQTAHANPHATLMERMIREQEIPFQSDLYRLGLRQYQENLELVIQQVLQADCPLLMSELVSNIRDQAPFISAPADTFPEADSVYHKARLLDEAGRYHEAKQLYRHARDLDQLRFRASDDLNDVIAGLGKTYAIPVIPLRSIFEKHASEGLVGDDLMADHLHPNIDGYFIMAEAFLDSIAPIESMSGDRLEAFRAYQRRLKTNWGITRLDTLHETLALNYLKSGWPFQKESGHQALMRQYRPRTYTDTLAGQIVFYHQLNLQQGHFKLAEHYERLGDYRQAFLAYHALIHHVPHELLFYEKAAELLLKLQHHSSALYWLDRSTCFGMTKKTSRLLGQLHLQAGHVKESIRFLQHARSMDSTNVQLLYLLGQAHILNRQPEHAQRTLHDIRKIDPGFVNARRLRTFQEMMDRYARD